MQSMFLININKWDGYLSLSYAATLAPCAHTNCNGIPTAIYEQLKISHTESAPHKQTNGKNNISTEQEVVARKKNARSKHPDYRVVEEIMAATSVRVEIVMATWARSGGDPRTVLVLFPGRRGHVVAAPAARSSGLPSLAPVVRVCTCILEKLNSARSNSPTEIFLVLLGFYTANALATILGQTGDWDVLVAGVVVAAIEGIGMLMYRAPIARPPGRFQSLIALVNYWKAGVCLGLFVDAFKLGS